MASFARVISFTSTDDSQRYFADIGLNTDIPVARTEVEAYSSFEDLGNSDKAQKVTIKELQAPVPNPELPIYCVGLNYSDHATEFKMNLPKYPPLWTKPKASLANPGEDIPINSFCASNQLDYEGELVFLTSKECRDITPTEAEGYILGYTTGNDITCRSFQAPTACGGQVFFAKGFDKFAPMGPTLLSAAEFDKFGVAAKLTTKVNGEYRQHAECPKDFVFKPAEILSHMSQGTTIPAYTAIMTGSPAGIGAFMDGGIFLKDGDVVEIELQGVGVLKNKIVFEKST